jgi:hypothetical protein
VTYTNTTGDSTNITASKTGNATVTVAETTNGAPGTSGVGQGITIADFHAGDAISIQNGIVGGAATPTVIAPPSGGFADLQAALNAATQGAQGTVSTVAFGGSSYLVVNNGITGFQATGDLAIKLTGITDPVSVAQATTVL